MLRTCRWIGAELKDPSKVDGTIDTPEFVEQVVEQIIPEQRIAALDLTFYFPPWFDDAMEEVFRFATFFSVSLGTPTETTECFTENLVKMIGYEPERASHWKHIAHAMYSVFYPILVIMWTWILDVIFVYVLYPPIDSRGWIPP